MNVLINPSPSCRCSDCVLHPVSSHGIHMIGVFRAAHVATMRGRSPLNVEDQVWTTWGNGNRAMARAPFDFARGI